MTRPAYDVPELVDVAGITSRLEVTEETVRTWRRSGRFPDPVAWLLRHRRAGAALWRWSDVWAFVQRIGHRAAADPPITYCRTCRALPGHWCVTPQGRKTGLHAARRRLA